MAATSVELIAWFLFLLTVVKYGTGGEDDCEDNITNCADFNVIDCQTYHAWAKEHCAKFCGMCSDKVKEECPEGWSLFAADQTCIRVFGKERINLRMNWGKSRERCNKLGGDLVQIRNEEKNSFVLDLVGEGVKGYAWIGLRNVAPHGFRFQFVDKSYLGDYHPWLPGNPDNFDGWEHCVSMYPKGNYSGQWNDYDCANHISYVCSTPSNTSSLAV